MQVSVAKSEILIEKRNETLAEEFQFSYFTLPNDADFPTETFEIADVLRVSRSIPFNLLSPEIDVA